MSANALQSNALRVGRSVHVDRVEAIGRPEIDVLARNRDIICRGDTRDAPGPGRAGWMAEVSLRRNGRGGEI